MVVWLYVVSAPTVPWIDPSPISPEGTDGTDVNKVRNCWVYFDCVVCKTPFASVPVAQTSVGETVDVGSSA